MDTEKTAREPFFLPGGKTRLLICVVTFTVMYMAFHAIVAALSH